MWIQTLWLPDVVLNESDGACVLLISQVVGVDVAELERSADSDGLKRRSKIGPRRVRSSSTLQHAI